MFSSDQARHFIEYFAFGAGITWLVFREIVPGLTRASAPRLVVRSVIGAFGLFMLVAAGAVVGILPWFSGLIASLLPLSFLVFSERYVTWAGGPIDRLHLHRAYYEMIDAAKLPLSDQNTEHVMRLAKELDRYRSAETDGFITLAQEEMYTWAKGEPEDKERSKRLMMAGDRLWGKGSTPTAV